MPSPQNFSELVRIFIDLALDTAPLLFSLIVLMFFSGIALFVFAEGNEKQMEQGKTLMTWGVIAMFIVFSLWGLSRFVMGFFFPSGLPTGPPTPNSSVIDF